MCPIGGFMTRYVLLVGSVVTLLLLYSSAEAETVPITPVKYQSSLRVGIDVDWAKTPKGRAAAQRVHKAGINVPKLFKARGFDHVRIRIKESVLDQRKSKITGMRLINEIKVLVDDSLKAGITPILAYRLDAYKNDPTSDAKLADAVAWWRTVAQTFKGYPYALAYDLVIEPAKKIKKHTDRLNLYYQKATEAIRRIDPKRIVIVAANKISNPYELKNLIVPKPTTYMMAEWHFYAAGSKRDNPKKQWTSGTAFEKNLITDKIQAAKSWSAQTGIPTWVGAWMPNNYNKKGTRERRTEDGAPDGGDHTETEQLAFAAFMSRSLQQTGIPFAINSDTKYFDREHNSWYPSRKKLLDVILKRYQ